MKQIWQSHDAMFTLLRNLWSMISFGFALSLSAAPVSANRAALDEIVATVRKQFGGRQWMFQNEDKIWVVTNKVAASGLPLDVAVNASDEFTTLLFFDILLPKHIHGVPNDKEDKANIPSHVKWYMMAVEDYFFERERISNTMQPLLLFRFDGIAIDSLGKPLDEFDLEDIMFLAEWFDLQPDFYTSYKERSCNLIDPVPIPWTPWRATSTWSTPPYARDCKSMEEVQNAALFPYTNALNRVKARLGGITWMESNGKGDSSLKLKRTKPTRGAEIRCDIQATDPPTCVLFSIKIAPVGVFTNDACWEYCHLAARERAEDAIGDYYYRLWGRRDCYWPHIDKVIDGKSEREWHPHNYSLPTAPHASEVSRIVASNIWEAQILKCTPDALFQKPHWCTNRFDFANPGASRFSTPMVTAATLEAYSNAIARIRTRFLGTNWVVVSSSRLKTPVVVTDVRVGIVPPILELRLASMPCSDGANGLEAIKAFSKEINAFVKTLPKMERRKWTFFPSFFIDGREIHVEAGDLSEKQLAGGHFQTGIYWSAGDFNVPDN